MGCGSSAVEYMTPIQTREPSIDEPDYNEPSVNESPPPPKIKVSGPTEFELSALRAHNKLRRCHAVPELTWSEECQESAQNWADYLASSNRLEHDCELHDFGQSIYFTENDVITGEEVTQEWYNEIVHYSFDNPQFTPSTGRFTQLVWEDSEFMGMGVSFREGGGTFVVAHYDPPGNVVHEGCFEANVFPAADKQKDIPTALLR